MAINSDLNSPIQSGQATLSTSVQTPARTPDQPALASVPGDGYEAAGQLNWTQNLQASCSAPVETVSSAMYEADVHFAMTWYLAKSQGFNAASARAIADGTELPDQDHRSPVPLGLQYAKVWLIRGSLDMRIPGMREIYDGLTKELAAISEKMEHNHFHRDGNAKAVVEGNESVTKLVREAMALSPLEFGETLHAYQDSFSHSGEPSLAKLGLYGGHPGNFTSHACDQTWQDPEKMLRAAEWTYGLLEDYWDAQPGLRDPNVSPKAFSEIKDVLTKFANAKTEKEKLAIMVNDMGLDLDAATTEMLEKDMSLPSKPKKTLTEPRFKRFGEN